MLGPIIPNLWFDGQAQDAAEFYCSVFPNSRVRTITRYPPGSPGEPGSVMTVSWEIDGQQFVGINGGPQFSFDEAVSFMITCADQDEVDYYWERLLADGGQEEMCGWLKDRFGVSWQIVPASMSDVLASLSGEAKQRYTEAFLQMKKLDIAALQRAAE